MLEKLLTRLGLEPGEITTYLALLESGPTAAGTLSRHTGIVRVTQYLFLKRLLEKSLISQTIKSGVKIFSAKSPESLSSFYEEKIQSYEQDFAQYKKILPELIAKKTGKFLLPRFEIFEGKEGLKNVLKDMLLYKNMETQAYWPIKTMVEALSGDFFRSHNKERIKNNLHTRAIWPANQVIEIKKHPYLGSGKEFKREIRIAPKDIDFTMGYWIYGNKVAFLSSAKESVGYIIESGELAEMLLTQFEMMWKVSKPLAVKQEDVESFLKEI